MKSQNIKAIIAWKKECAIKDFQSNLSFLESRVETMKITAKNDDYDCLNSLGELQALGSSLDNSIGNLKTILEIEREINYELDRK